MKSKTATKILLTLLLPFAMLLSCQGITELKLTPVQVPSNRLFSAMENPWQAWAGVSFTEDVMKNKFHVEKKCKQCGKLFMVATYRLKWGRGKYCSRKCDGLYHRRNIVIPIFSKEDSDLCVKAWKSRRGYASINIRDKNFPHRSRIYKAHRIVLSRMVGRVLNRWELCDHINFKLLDCRRQNLRLVNASQNAQHRNHSQGKHRNAYYIPKSKKWLSSCMIRGIRYRCGMWSTLKQAMESAERKRKELHAI